MLKKYEIGETNMKHDHDHDYKQAHNHQHEHNTKHNHQHDGECCSSTEQTKSPTKKGESSCSCEEAQNISFAKLEKQPWYKTHRETFIMLIRIALTGLTFIPINLIIGKDSGHSAVGIGSEMIQLGPLTIPVVLFYLIPYLIIGYDILLRSAKNIARGKVFDENFLMSIATIGALALGQYSEAIAVMIFYQSGEMLQDFAVRRSKRSITELMDIRPDYANIEQNGVLTQVSPTDIEIGQIIIVKPGEKVPLDGVLVEGEGNLDTSALTGEAFPRFITAGTEVLSGCLNLTGVLRIKVTKPFGESTVSKILNMVENASTKKAHTERFITRFARYYTPIVVFAAIALAIIPPLALGGEWTEWIRRSLILLVISCPCALVVSVPLSFFAGIGCASKNGILVKGGNYLEALSKLEIAVFDKTGTLTQGVFTVTAVHIVPECEDPCDKTEHLKLLEVTALAERYSNHPISLSIKKEYQTQSGNNVLDTSFEKRVKEVKEIAGQGVQAIVDGKTVHAGNSRLMESINIKWRACEEFGSIVHIAIDGTYAGHIIIADEPKPESAATITELKKMGIHRTIMLTGDGKTTGEHIGKELGLDAVYTELLPADKVCHVEALLAEQKEADTKKSRSKYSEARRGTLAFVGDGINDAPVLALADIGIAMGGLGSDAAIEAADVVLMDDNPAKLPLAIRISRKALTIVKQNIGFALSVKAIVMVLGVFGIATMWMALFADTGVTLIAVLNSMRALKMNPQKKTKADKK